MTIPELFQESVERFGAYPALASKNGKKWDTVTFSQYYQVCCKAARSLIKVGSSPPLSGSETVVLRAGCGRLWGPSLGMPRQEGPKFHASLGCGVRPYLRK